MATKTTVTSLTKEEIEAKKEALKNKVSESKKKALVGRSSPAKDFLTEISDIVKDALNHNVSYKQLTKDIFDVYSFKVSEQTLRAFAQSVLGVKKGKKNNKKSIAAAPVENKVLLTDNKDISIAEMKQQQASKSDDLDNLM